MEVRQVGVVGAGQMGNGIAHVFALAGYQVLMTDISEDSLSKALALIERNIERQVSKGKVLPADKRAAMERIKTTLNPKWGAGGSHCRISPRALAVRSSSRFTRLMMIWRPN
jgi:3-hydroxyacyl-CoA dehydrogenase